VNDRRVLNGILWVLRSGAPWRDLPDSFGPYTTCYNRFVRWWRAGVWGRIMNALAGPHDAAVQMIDTSIVRVHQHGACITRNRSGAPNELPRWSPHLTRQNLRDVMKTLLIALGLTAAGATLATPAHAVYLEDCLRGAPCPGFYAPSPRYYGPSPYYAPPTRYYGPSPYYDRPRRYYGPPQRPQRYYGPPF
jgi:transposase